MTLDDAAKNGITRLRQPEWAWNSFAELYLVNGGYGPWVQIVDLPNDPVTVLIAGLPQDGWEAWTVPAEFEHYYQTQIPEKFKHSLWED